MSFSSNHRNSKRRHIVSDINITPFVDVLLVLLIIFMVAAPMMTSSVDINLPKGAPAPVNERTQPISISIKADGSIFLEENSVKLTRITSKLFKLTKNNLNTKIYVRADKALDYGRVMEVIKVVNLAGFKQVSLATELTQ